jgi:hypothetical protein
MHCEETSRYSALGDRQRTEIVGDEREKKIQLMSRIGGNEFLRPLCVRVTWCGMRRSHGNGGTTGEPQSVARREEKAIKLMT